MKTKMLALLAGVFCLASGVFSAEKKLQREANLREGPGAYYAIVQRVKSGEVFDTDKAESNWLFGRTGTVEGWLPGKAFEKRGAGLDYSGFLAESDVTVVSSVDIAAATKGAFAASYSSKHQANFESAERIHALKPDVEQVRLLLNDLQGRPSEQVLRRLPPLEFKNNIVLRQDAEELLGRALVARLVDPGLVENRGLVDYVNAVAAVVGARTERYDLTYRVAVLDDDGINGFGLPGGYIVVTRGLLDQVRNEAELACLLAHEMAHVSRYHGLREFQKREVHRRRDSLFAELDSISGGGEKDEVEEDLNKLADTAYLTIIGGRAREDELEADAFGVAYAAAAGYDPTSMLDLLERIARNPPADEMFRHHPSLADRMEALQRDVAAYDLTWDGQKRLEARFQVRMAHEEASAGRME